MAGRFDNLHAIERLDPERDCQRTGLATKRSWGQARCGLAAIATHQGLVGILNLNTLTAQPRSVQPATPVFYNAEDISERVRRREKLWTPVEGDA